MNGIETGYLKTSPFEAFIDATTTQISLRTIRDRMIGIPISIKHRGIASTMYISVESWKLSAAFPLKSTHADSCLRDIQQTIGPIMPPRGKKYPAKAER